MEFPFDALERIVIFSRFSLIFQASGLTAVRRCIFEVNVEDEDTFLIARLVSLTDLEAAKSSIFLFFALFHGRQEEERRKEEEGEGKRVEIKI